MKYGPPQHGLLKPAAEEAQEPWDRPGNLCITPRGADSSGFEGAASLIFQQPFTANSGSTMN